MSQKPQTLETFLASLPEWQDDLKARSMFASFSQPREVNPEAWDARFGFWRMVITEGLDRGLLGDSVFGLERPEDLPFRFCRQHITPLGLADVVAEMRQRGQLLASDALDCAGSPFTERIFWGPLRTTWGWVLGLGGIGGVQSHAALVVPELLQRWTDRLIRHVTERSRHTTFAALFTLEGLQGTLNELRRKAGMNATCSINDAATLVRFMKSRGALVELEASEAGQESILRIRLANERAATLTITEEQRGVLQLQSMASKLSSHVARLESQMAEAKASLMSCLREKDRPAALQHLRRRKEFERLRDQRLGCLATIEAMLLKMEDAQSDAEVFEAYRVGERSLRAMLGALPSAGAVDDLLLDVQELVAGQETLSQAMAQAVPGSQEEEEGLEAELAELLLSTLPAAPTPLAERALHRVEDAMEQLHLTSPTPARAVSSERIALPE